MWFSLVVCLVWYSFNTDHEYGLLALKGSAFKGRVGGRGNTQWSHHYLLIFGVPYVVYTGN